MFKKPQSEAPLDEAIDNVLSEMKGYSPTAPEYATMVNQLVKLHSLKETPKRISPETWITVGANLVGIVLILHHERTNLVTSKALSFVTKLL